MVDDWYGNTVVYTAVVTDYEHIAVSNFTEGVDYVFFTDGGSHPVEDRWKVEPVPDVVGHIHPRRVAKIPKVYPWFFDKLREYKYAIWIDGDMQILRSSFVPEILSFMDNGLVLSPHCDGRHCAYGEATIRPEKYAKEPLDAQVAWYEAEGFPTEYGLYEGGVLAWDMTNPRAKELGMFWLVQNMIFSYQDQVSLPYALWKMNFTPDVLPASFRVMPPDEKVLGFGWVHINAHKRSD